MIPTCFGFIPARYASTRFPGKPLANIMGKPMFWHVWSRAKRCARFTSVHLCTDDERIASAAAALGVPVVMTGESHPNGSSRVYEAAAMLAVPDDAVVVNIQGDEPALNPAMLDSIVAPFSDATVLAATLACPMGREEARSPDRVKVALDAHGNALYFSRAAIPFERDCDLSAPSPFLLHVGIYAYRMRTLAHYVQLPPSPLEEMEKLEQLRLLENGIPMRVSITNHRAHGVDRPEDLERIISLMVNQ